MIKVPKPKEGEFSPYAVVYFNTLGEDDALQTLIGRATEAEKQWRAIAADKQEYRYAEDKWTVKQVIGHIADTERIFGYRALCIVRGETVNLPGYEENEYAAAGKHNERSLDNIIDEWVALRQANIILFSTFTTSDFNIVGKANNQNTSVAAIIYALAGHEKHHTHVLKERYGI